MMPSVQLMPPLLSAAIGSCTTCGPRDVPSPSVRSGTDGTLLVIDGLSDVPSLSVRSGTDGTLLVIDGPRDEPSPSVRSGTDGTPLVIVDEAEAAGAITSTAASAAAVIVKRMEERKVMIEPF